MKRFLLKSISFSSFICLIVISIFALNRYFADFKLDDSKHSIILGHSHPECAYNDSLINSLANYAQSGESYFYTYFKLKLLLEQNPTIKHVFIEYTNNQIEESMDEWIWGDKYMSYRFPKYASFMDYQSIKLLVNKNPKCFKESIAPWLKHNFKMITKRLDYVHNDFGGFEYLIRDKTDSSLLNSPKINDSIEYITKLSANNIEYLQKIIQYCKNSKVDIFLIRSPLHKKYPGYQNEKVFQELLKSKFSGTEFLDFSKFQVSNSEFGDLEHLNYKGAKIFSKWFADLLEHGLLKKVDKQIFIDKEIEAHAVHMSNIE